MQLDSDSEEIASSLLNKLSETKKRRPNKECGLAAITFQFMHWLRKNKNKNDTIAINKVFKELGVKLRRVYVVVNIFEAIGLLKRIGKGTYTWLGGKGLRETCAVLATTTKVVDEDSKHIKTKAKGMLSSFLHLKEGECKFVKRMRDEYDFVNVLRAVGLVLRMPNSIDQKFGYVWNFKCPYLYENKEFF